MTDFPPDHITGPRLLLRPPALEDADAIYDRIASDPEVTRFLLWSPHPDVAETRRVIINQLLKNNHERSWVITLRNSGDVVGLISCRRQVPHSVEVGYCLSRQWWDKGVMSEALNALVAELANDPRVFRIWATCHVDNARSARLLQRAGFALEGRLVRHAVYPTMGVEPHDSLLYARILR
ncbi:N-acetyltransferase [Mycobacterium kubicae]|uniref:N-acetyltransferase n=1 Tax=Mycobacterium kubicae TaxID=120959 RepID=A0AAX1JH29_9MYCO|nr:GNAT family N-acetyltransferase [Mycobacterium kubicae]MCV7097254.1 GNAT family N-acetyltransferase [Mycobacterium kubicae]ORW03913.1 GNAT family acetyltransferase [Mycobacterium kubicae]QNI11644.1 GNAT family N-acetyltransferase [Mycobacterium kubicae]QPI39865.1 GNAT family N-acetyltransferase [Mycobacterium kubicae]GFG64517.1 N-acetyltransferase [Mycobacterium kubicae]